MSSSSSCSKTLSQCEVVSKYFTSKTVMDDSLNDFQEKKKNIAGPKNNKVKSQVKKTKSAPKRIRGQKDIRSALKQKKNELIAYSNDFDKVCKKSGIDVDSEQLQLAIALSKSLQQASTTEDSQSSGSSSQDRTGKIRSTLQEYGFVVPEIKITKTKKVKKHRKNYKLLIATIEEKLQIISDRYSKVLFDNFDNSRPNPDKRLESSSKLYHLVTNITYKEINTCKKFYVDNLLEKPSYKIGGLLRDWSEIPGRPASPVKKAFNFNFEHLDCTQEELDIILSGSIKNAQEIAGKYNFITEVSTLVSDTNLEEDISQEDNTETDTKMDVIDVETEELGNKSPIFNINKELGAIDKVIHMPATQIIRSCSPDIFDDELSVIESPKYVDLASQPRANLSSKLKSPIKNVTKVLNEVMDLTECVVIKTTDKPLSQLSQGTNVTKRQSNDFMEITNCVTGSSQPIREDNAENIDLTQSPEDETEKVSNMTLVNKNDLVNLDLTQSSDSNELPFVQISGKNCLDDTVIVYDDYSKVINQGTKEEIVKNDTIIETIAPSPIDLETSMKNNENDKLTENIDIENDNDLESNLDATILLPEPINTRAISPIEHVAHNYNSIDNGIERILTVSSNTNEKMVKEQNKTKSKTESFFEEFIHQHSEISKENTDDVINIDESVDIVTGQNNGDEIEDIDLTQSSDYSEDQIDVKKVTNSESLAKSNDRDVIHISRDIDDMFDDMVKSHASSLKSISCKSSSTSRINIDHPSNSDLVSNSSQVSEVFEISDNELDYSLHKSRLDVDVGQENFDFGGISVVDNMPDIPSLRKSNNRGSMSDSFLSNVDMKDKNRESTIYSPENSIPSIASPLKEPEKNIIAKTPKNSEYIMKTDEITPMLDYESMSTPEMNAELDKYGLKPFKRKRAIQLLTHVYNQTHPRMETCSTEELPSPSKRLKNSISPRKISTMFKSKKSVKSPIKTTPTKVIELGDIYEETTEIVEIRDLDCNEEDWVFQKREKAQVHSCKVPLHIAFHNYVSCRLNLREAILRYEPVNIDVIHKGLVRNGFRYDPKDLLKFMDKKCITVKTVDNNARNKRQ